MAYNMKWVTVLQEILSMMNTGGKSEAEEERIRRIMREVMSEPKSASASERDMMHSMMQLLEHNVTKHSAELQATAQERDRFKAKMDELNLRMEQLKMDRGGPPSGGEGPELTDRQKRLAEIWEELQDMRERKRSDQTTQGKPFNKGGERGGHGFSGTRKPQHWSQNEREFGRQNKDGASFSPEEYPSRGRDSEKLGTGPHKDYKSGGFQSKPFQQDNRYQEGPMSSPKAYTEPGGRDGRHDFVPFFSKPFQQDNRYQEGPMSFPKTYTQPGGRDGRHDFVPFSSNTYDNQGLQFDNRHWQGDSSPGFINRDAAQNVGMHNRGPNKSQHQNRGRSNDRGQHQQRRGQCNPRRGQFHQYRGQSQDGRQGQRSFDSGSRNPPKDFSSSQFTPEEIEAIKIVLKQREATAGAESTGKSGSPPLLENPSKTAVKKAKEKKQPTGAGAVKSGSPPLLENPSKTAVKKEKVQKQPTGAGAVFDSGSRNPPKDFSSSQFTPEEIEAIKIVLKQREATAGAESTGKSGSPPLLENPSKTAVKKEKEQKQPTGAGAVLPDDSDSDSDSDDSDALTSSKELSGDAGETCFAKATDEKPVADSKKKKKKKKNTNKGSKEQGTAQQKPEGLSPLEVFTASGFDMSHFGAVNVDQAVNDVMLIAKENGNMVSCQPKTVREMVEFKEQYPNAQAIIVKTSEQK